MRTWTPCPLSAFRDAGITAASVFPSPVCISTTAPPWSANAATICTSNGRRPEGPARDLADEGVGPDLDLVEGPAAPRLRAQRLRALRQRRIVEGLELRLQAAHGGQGLSKAGQSWMTVDPRSRASRSRSPPRGLMTSEGSVPCARGGRTAWPTRRTPTPSRAVSSAAPAPRSPSWVSAAITSARWSSKREAVRVVQAAVDAGITFMDNAWEYHDGESETRMGKALADGAGAIRSS